MGWHMARGQKVNLSVSSFSSLLFVLMEGFQAHNVGSPGSRQLMQPSSEAFVSGYMVNSRV